MKRLVRPALVWLCWWIVLLLLWLVYAGEWNRYQWIGGAAAAAVAASAALVVRGLGLLRFQPQWQWVARSKRVPFQVVVDFWILVVALFRALVLRREVRGVFRAREFPATGTDPDSAFQRAWAGVAATYSPNAYAIDFDPERGTVLVHDLVANRGSEDPL